MKTAVFELIKQCVCTINLICFMALFLYQPYFLKCFPTTGRLLKGKSRFKIIAAKAQMSSVFTVRAAHVGNKRLVAVMPQNTMKAAKIYRQMSFNG